MLASDRRRPSGAHHGYRQTQRIRHPAPRGCARGALHGRVVHRPREAPDVQFSE